MEESEILRRNQFVLRSIEISCETIDRGYQISTLCPRDNLLNCPTIKEKGIPFSEHPMLRPFDKFLLNGNPNIWKVTHVFILCPQINRPAIVCSIVKTEKRIEDFEKPPKTSENHPRIYKGLNRNGSKSKSSILILPAWGTGLMRPQSNQNVRGLSPVAHMTIEEDAQGDFKIHYTGSIE